MLLRRREEGIGVCGSGDDRRRERVVVGFGECGHGAAVVGVRFQGIVIVVVVVVFVEDEVFQFFFGCGERVILF